MKGMGCERRQNEAVLACSARRGDRETLRELLVRNWGWLKGLVYSVVGSGQDVDDCLQDICVRVIDKIDTLREPERFRPWLAVVARRRALEFRQRKRRKGVSLDGGLAEQQCDERAGQFIENMERKERCEQVLEAAGGGVEVSLEIIHLGERKKVTLTLTSLVKNSEFKGKFPLEPEVVQSWQPGRVFQLQPELDQWIQVGSDGKRLDDADDAFRSLITVDSRKFLKKVYVFQYSTDGEGYTITIEGDPNDEKAEITVDTGDSHFMRRLENIDKLPEEHREAAKQALKKARRMAEARQHKKDVDTFVLPEVPVNYFNQRQDTLRRRLERKLEPSGNMFERIEKQMREMQ